jgi:hypothetical protein
VAGISAVGATSVAVIGADATGAADGIGVVVIGADAISTDGAIGVTDAGGMARRSSTASVMVAVLATERAVSITGRAIAAVIPGVIATSA